MPDISSVSCQRRVMITETGIRGFAKEQLETLLEDYDRLFARKEALSKRIAEIVPTF